MRPLPPGQDGVDYCKIRRDRNIHHHHHSSNGGTLRRSSASSASLLEPPSPTERYHHGTIEGHYRVHDLALDRYVPPPSPERYSSNTSTVGRPYHNQHHHHHHQQQQQQQQLQQQQQQLHNQRPQLQGDRYASSSCHSTTGGSAGGGGRNHYLPVSRSTSENFMSPPSPVAERFDYAARHHDGYHTTAAKRNESVYSR